MRIEVVRNDGDLKREVWQFFLNIDYGRSVIRFERYALEERATKRRIWQNKGLWDKIDLRLYHSTVQNPPLPADVEAEARQRFAEAVAKLPITK